MSDYIYENEDELYEIYEKIGEGAFSNVYRALFIPSGEIIALKKLK
jgi:serine/threonine protein kinase